MPPPTDEQTALLVGVDVGGTFTDLVAFDPTSGALKVIKLPSSPPNFHQAVIESVHRAVQQNPSLITQHSALRLIHGSTVATNALLQRAGEPVAFITTEGFRDMLLIGRQNRPRLFFYDRTLNLPAAKTHRLTKHRIHPFRAPRGIHAFPARFHPARRFSKEKSCW